MTDELVRGRSAAARRMWSEAYANLTAADQQAPLGVDDLETLAYTSYMIGKEHDLVEFLERAHRAHLEAGDLPAAARTAVWIGINLALTGDSGPSSGWFGRAERLVERHGGPCAAQGYLFVAAALRSTMSGDHEAAIAAATEAIAIGERCAERDLVALAVHEQGRAMVRMGRIDQGLRLLDEAMVAVTADDLTPMVTGIIYCSVIEGCYEVQELRRAQTWTEALTEWCGEQPGLVAFTGQCLTHRAELLQLRGDWDDAMSEAARAAERFEIGTNPFPAARAHYRRGELHRMRGEYERAERAYREAGARGWSPQPGLALLRMAQGEATSAQSAIRTALREANETLTKAGLLPAQVEISVALGDVDAAAAASDELDGIALHYRGTMIAADSHLCRGSVLMARNLPAEALEPLGRARTAWIALDAPYETARARLLMGRAYEMLGDETSAAFEIELAREAFERLGAVMDFDLIRATREPESGLTDRELEVLRLVATGRTNKAVADDLHLSVRTVDRHLSNIYTKLGVDSRTAAASYAYEKQLL